MKTIHCGSRKAFVQLLAEKSDKIDTNKSLFMSGFSFAIKDGGAFYLPNAIAFGQKWDELFDTKVDRNKTRTAGRNSFLITFIEASEEVKQDLTSSAGIEAPEKPIKEVKKEEASDTTVEEKETPTESPVEPEKKAPAKRKPRAKKAPAKSE